ncbi:MAG: hypothetical protein CL908_00460 [Deltaproteobacteria bacterium]|nr:hypothetical protein [Deltaproteobacteria bacterium]
MTIGAGESAVRVDDGSAPAFLGWRMLGVAFMANFLASAVTLSPFGNFVVPMSEAFQVHPSTIGYGIAMAILTMGIAGPFVGRWLDQGLARRMMTVGALLTGVGLLMLSRATELWYAGFCYVGIACMGAAFFGVMPSMTLIANWFVRRRGLAIGITVAGATVASYVAPATSQYLIDHYGWRTAVFAFGCLTLGVSVPLFARFVIARPEEAGQLPDGDAPSQAEEVGPSEDCALRETSDLMRDPQLWLLAVGFGLVMTSPVVLIGVAVPYGQSLGFSGQDANLFYLAMAPFSLLGKLVIGGLADVAPIKPAIVMVVLVNVLVWWLFYIEPSYTLFVVTGAIYGVGIGGAAPLHGVAQGLVFGRANFGRAGGLGAMAAVPLLAIASAASHALLGATGSYSASFVLQMSLVSLGGLLLVFLPIPRHSPGAS